MASPQDQQRGAGGAREDELGHFSYCISILRVNTHIHILSVLKSKENWKIFLKPAILSLFNPDSGNFFSFGVDYYCSLEWCSAEYMPRSPELGLPLGDTAAFGLIIQWLLLSLRCESDRALDAGTRGEQEQPWFLHSRS